jgi:hypothetical protein
VSALAPASNRDVLPAHTWLVHLARGSWLVTAAIIGVALGGCTATGTTAPRSTAAQLTLSNEPSPQPTGLPTNAAAGCAVATAELPIWAQAGFSPPTETQRYVLGVNRNIVGVLFGYPLRSPAHSDRMNKILWVSRLATEGPLEIQARLAGSSRVASRQLADGPGPSIIDMPTPGCWIFDLSWSGHTDQVAVPYSAS